MSFDSPLTGLLASDALRGCFWLAATALLFFAAWRAARTLFPRDALPVLLVHVIVLSWAAIVAVAVLLGLAGMLNGIALLVGVSGLALGTLAAVRRLTGDHSGKVLPEGSERLWLLAWAALVGFWIGHVITHGLLRFPTDWDSLNYHIPLIVQWLHAGSLYAPDCSAWSVPGNNELWGLWAVAPFSGDFLIHLTNFPASLLLAAAGLAFGSAIGLSRPLAHLGALLMVCNTVVLKQLVDVENDVAVAACFFAALVYVVRYLQSPNRGDLVLGAISAGLLAGVKFYALGYAVLVGGAWLLAAAWRHGLRNAYRVFLAGVAGVLLFGGYWYLRNLVMTGSPVYPSMPFAATDVLRQIYPDVRHTSFAGNRRPELLGLFLAAIWGIMGHGPLVGFVLVPVSLVWLAASTGCFAFSRQKDELAGTRLFLAMVLAGSGVLLAITPFAVEDDPGTLNQLHWQYCPIRYGLCLLNASTLAALLVVQQSCAFINRLPARPTAAKKRCFIYHAPHQALPLGVAGTAFVQLFFAITRSGLSWIDDVQFAVNLLLDAAILLAVGSLASRLRSLLLEIVLVLGFSGCMWSCIYLAQRWHDGFAGYYDRFFGTTNFSYLGQRNPPAGKLCVLEHRPYAFFGSRRNYRICQPMYVASPEYLLRFLRVQNVSVVAARYGAPEGAAKTFQAVAECLERFPDRFFPITDPSRGMALFWVRAIDTR